MTHNSIYPSHKARLLIISNLRLPSEYIFPLVVPMYKIFEALPQPIYTDDYDTPHFAEVSQLHVHNSYDRILIG